VFTSLVTDERTDGHAENTTTPSDSLAWPRPRHKNSHTMSTEPGGHAACYYYYYSLKSNAEQIKRSRNTEIHIIKISRITSHHIAVQTLFIQCKQRSLSISTFVIEPMIIKHIIVKIRDALPRYTTRDFT